MEVDDNRQCVLAFLQAYFGGEAAAAEACCDEELDSIVYAPIDLFPHFGQKHGRGWLSQAIAIEHQLYSKRKFEVTFVAAEGNRVATMTRCAQTKRSDARVVQYVAAQFFTLKDRRILEHRAFLDSFDLVQQLVGRDLTDELFPLLDSTAPAPAGRCRWVE